MFCGRGDGLVGKVLAVQTRGPEFDPLHPRKNARCSNMYRYPSAGEAGTRGSLTVLPRGAGW